MNQKLKPVPKGNKGLPKLPKEVRNNMGFLKDGGVAKDKRSPFMGGGVAYKGGRSEEHTELQSQSTISYAVFCLKKKKTQ